ncbi:MAG: DUF3592 domain-containing protein [Myxococcota bacterium]
MSQHDPRQPRPRVVRTIGQQPGGPPPPSPPRPPEASNALTRGLLAFATLCLAVGMVWAMFVFGRYRIAAGSRDWPNTLGQVMDCREGVSTPSNRDQLRNELTYRYDVDDQKYVSRNVSLEGYQAFDCADYPLGKAVRVYYAPWRPKLATLTPGEGAGNLSTQFAGAIVCMLIGLLLGASQVAVLFRPEWMRPVRVPRRPS